MLKWITCGLTFAAALGTDGPFWKVKEKAYERIKDHEILVSVRTENSSNPLPKKHLFAVGGGQARASCEFTYITSQKYEKYPEISGYIKKSHFDPDKKVLTFTIEAYSYKADLQIEMNVPAFNSTSGIVNHLTYKIVGGPLVGFAGTAEFVSLSPSKCEVGFRGDYSYDEFPIPKVFLEFGMEVVMQKMATRMRGYIEEQWKLESVKSKGPVK